MSRPLIVTDCDEVLLHMIIPFSQWLDETHGIRLDLDSSFEEALRHKASNDPVERTLVGELLGGFFDTEMGRQTPIAGARAAMARLGGAADIVCLTNLADFRQPARAAQLASHGIPLPVECNRGGKGPALARIVARYRPSVTIFLDDLESNHASVAVHVPQVWRIQMIGEPMLAPHVATCRDAHVRIDDWPAAEGWIGARIAEAA